MISFKQLGLLMARFVSRELMITSPAQSMSKVALVLPFAFCWLYLMHTILWGWWK